MDFEPKGFDPEDIRPRDVPAACWHIVSRVFPAALITLALGWALIAGIFILGQ